MDNSTKILESRQAQRFPLLFKKKLPVTHVYLQKHQHAEVTIHKYIPGCAKQRASRLERAELEQWRQSTASGLTVNSAPFGSVHFCAYLQLPELTHICLSDNGEHDVR